MLSYLNIALFIFMGLTLIVLIWGIITMMRGRTQDAMKANKLMRARVLLQFIALMLLLVGMIYKYIVA